MIRISVIGTRAANAIEAEQAFEVGRLIAERGGVLICGGLSGVMEHAARGAKEVGGLTIGILPGYDPAQANRWIDIPISTGMTWARNVVVATSGQAVIAIGGGPGTLSEIAYAAIEGRPVIALGSWELDTDRLDSEIISASSPQEAVDRAFDRINI